VVHPPEKEKEKDSRGSCTTSGQSVDSDGKIGEKGKKSHSKRPNDRGRLLEGLTGKTGKETNNGGNIKIEMIKKARPLQKGGLTKKRRGLRIVRWKYRSGALS